MVTIDNFNYYVNVTISQFISQTNISRNYKFYYWFFFYNEHYLPQIWGHLILINTCVNCYLFLKGAWNITDQQPELKHLIVVKKIIQ